VTEQHRKALAFRQLHEGPAAFVVANPWDAGTARLFAGLGYRALATTSGGVAFSLGRADAGNRVDRDETLACARAIVEATGLPVTGDLESGHGPRPEDVAETVRLAAAAGLVGGSIEDATGDPAAPILPLGAAVERVAAAAEAARALDFPFTLTARAENLLYGRHDLDDTVRRLQAFEAAGADVLFAPGLPDAAAVRTVCSAVGRPVNVLAAGPLTRLTVAELAGLGARRISVGSGLARAALAAAVRTAREPLDEGTFDLLDDALPYADLNALLADGPQ